MRRWPLVSLLVLVTTAAAATPAHAAFPYLPGPDPSDYGQYRLEASDSRPNELTPGAKQTWMYAADQEAGNDSINSDPRELNGVRGAHLIDATTPNDDLAWATTVGRPDVTIQVLDSGIKWNDRGAMLDLRRKTHLNKGEVPVPRSDRSTPLESGENCSSYTSQYDANGDGVFNVVDYACDSRVERDPAQRGGVGVGPSDLLDPQDVLIAFSDGTDDDSNGFVDDIVGWDFLDDDNDPFDDVQYGHGTGEARDSTGEADNGGEIGSCPNCMVVYTRVGDSFIADSNRFAQATIYATDNGVDVVQEALGTLNNSSLSRAAVDYAYEHGVTVIASAADEAAQHHNWPSTLPHVIIVNSITKYDLAITPATHSYLQFNGCTNFSSKIAIGIPSVSCSSDATGRASGMAGLIYSAALNARAQGALAHHPTCTRTDGSACLITPNEVRQIMASGRIDGVAQADDVNFAEQPEPSCTQARVPACTDPNLNAPYDSAVPSPLVTTKRYPTRRGHDQIFGYGRVNMNRAVDALVRTGDAAVPPEVEITAPDWYEQIDPGRATFALRGQIYARGGGYSCDVYIAPGSQPNNDLDTASTPGDFKRVPSAWCNGDVHTSSFDGVLADVDVQDLRALFPASAGDFDGREPGTGVQTSNGRPNTEPYGFTVKVVAHPDGDTGLQGEDRRNMYLHHDEDMLPGFPRKVGQASGDGESSPIFVDLDGDNRNELVMGSTDGFVHAYRPDGSELPGWPVRGDMPPLHTGGRAFQSGEVSDNLGGAILGSVAAADLDRDGAPEVVGADLEGKVYVWDDRGRRLFDLESTRAYSGKPLQPFADVRYVPSNPDESKRRRTQHGFVGSPVLVDLDGNDGGKLEIVAAAMDRHVYAWNDDGSPVPGFPVLVVDPSKVSSVDSQTHAVTFNSNAGEALNQGAIVVTPAVGDLTGDGKPEIVVGTNEEYATNQGNEGPINSSTFNSATVALLAQVGGFKFDGNPAEDLADSNGRVFAIHPDGTDHAGGPFLPGWPAKVAQLQHEILPVVGEGVAGAPAIGPVECPNGGLGPKVGTVADAGPAYILNPAGQSCYGRDGGRDITLQTDFAASPQKYDSPAIPAFGHPIFAGLGPTVSLFMPAAGLVRALDIALNEYQGGQDFVAGWEAHTGQFRAGWPSPVNDLQFLTGPVAANVDAAPGEEIVSGTASLDLAAFNGAGAVAGPGWPKLTSDWMVANPLVGSFGTNDLDSDARNRVVALTRSGSVLAYRTDAPPCPLGSWPRYHHDNANSGDYARDAVSPGKPIGVSVSGTTMNFTAPGDDLLCGTADRYEIVTSNEPIDGDNFDQADPLGGAPAPEAAGSEQSFVLPSGTKAFVAIRAVDEQGNVGRPVVVTTGYPRPKSASPLRVSLVPAYRECTAPNEEHGPPLGYGSCNPPGQESPTLTVGTIDANGFAANAVAYVRFRVHAGDPDTPADEADVGLTLSATDVRCAATNAVCPGGRGSDYAGRVLVSTVLRITDRDNDVAAGGGSDPATVSDVPLEVPAGCAPTAGTQTGATCAVSTTVDAVLPGAVTEGDRAVWQMGRVELRDAGPNGTGYGSGCPSTCGDGDEATFMRQGVFIP